MYGDANVSIERLEVRVVCRVAIIWPRVRFNSAPTHASSVVRFTNSNLHEVRMYQGGGERTADFCNLHRIFVVVSPNSAATGCAIDPDVVP